MSILEQLHDSSSHRPTLRLLIDSANKVFTHVHDAVQADGQVEPDHHECLLKTLENVTKSEFKALEDQWRPEGRFMRVC